MYEIDFLPVDCESTAGSTKSGDAIAIRFTSATDGQVKIVIIDGGYQATGPQVVEHVRHNYRTNHVDLVISTHPDGDHLNGLQHIIEVLDVAELMVHQPRQHAGRRVAQFRNIEAIDNLLAAARARGTEITDPFTGTERFEGQLVLLGPDKDFYEQLVAEHLDQVVSESMSKSMSLSNLRSRAWDLLDRAVAMLPFEETLTDIGDTDPRNETSVITLLKIGGERMLLTGDAGIRALTPAADDYEARVGAFASNPLGFLQIPHHGGQRNVGPTILDRILGDRSYPYGNPLAFVSAAAAAEKHPAPSVVNAVMRRGASVVATLGKPICHNSPDAPLRPGWAQATPLPPLDESGDSDD